MVAQERNTGRPRHLQGVEAREFEEKDIKEAVVVGGKVYPRVKNPEQKMLTTPRASQPMRKRSALEKQAPTLRQTQMTTKPPKLCRPKFLPHRCAYRKLTLGTIEKYKKCHMRTLKNVPEEL